MTEHLKKELDMSNVSPLDPHGQGPRGWMWHLLWQMAAGLATALGAGVGGWMVNERFGIF
ncbi:hypothetical protein ACIGD1_34390 [Streptomyces sp. NPDC085612]|uniref:hypothetical protein n=1 Tax=Streptomyces sp. NPDC085612 TaxID=3365732 RepID=UPI0037D62555